MPGFGFDIQACEACTCFHKKIMTSVDFYEQFCGFSKAFFFCSLNYVYTKLATVILYNGVSMCTALLYANRYFANLYRYRKPHTIV